MYSSLDKIDIVVKDPMRYVQTDHRERAEIEAEPEISVLFALTRMLGAKAHAESEGIQAEIVYAPLCEDLPPFLLEAVASAGAVVEYMNDRKTVALPKTAARPSELADRAFQGLAKRVAARCGLTDMAAVLHALEAETLSDPPDQEENEIEYWTRVLELAAVTCEILRARHGGVWEQLDKAEFPFAFGSTGGIMTLATNRAHRFISDGEGESMFLLLASNAEYREQDTLTSGPVMPNLRARGEAEGQKMARRELMENAPETSDFPVIAYGNDSPQSFAIRLEDRADDLDKLHAEAMANIAKEEVTVDPLEVDDLTILAVSGSYYAAEKLLDPVFMRTLHRRLGQELLAVSVPRRGLMFVAPGIPTDQRHIALLHAATKHESQTSRSISEAILLVSEGQVVGRIQIAGNDGSEADDDAPAPPKKKPGLLKRLFGRG